MPKQRNPEELFSSLLALELKSASTPLDDKDKEEFAQILNQIKESVAQGYQPDGSQKSILNRLSNSNSPQELLDITIQTLRDMPQTEEKTIFINTLKAYQQEAIVQSEENTAMPENTLQDFNKTRKEITNLEKHQRKSNTDHSAEITEKIQELVAAYEGMSSLDDKRRAKDSLRSLIRLVNKDEHAELFDKLNSIVNEKVAEQPEETIEQTTTTPQESEAEAEHTEEQAADTEAEAEHTEELAANTEAEAEAEHTEEQAADTPNEDLPFNLSDENNEGENEDFVTNEQQSPFFTVISFSEEEVDELLNSQDIEEYKASINPKISKKDLDDCLFIDATRTAVALANPDDMLVAYDYLEKDQKGITSLDEALIEQLKGMDTSQISPEGAYAWQHLAERIRSSNPDVYATFVSRLQESLRDYDYAHFSNGWLLSADELHKNYQEASTALEGFEPTEEVSSKEDDKEPQTRKTLDGYTFTNDKGHPLKNGFFHGKQLTDTREAILAQARELAAQELAKTPLPEDAEQKKALLNSVMNEKIASILADPDKKTFTKSEVAARLAGAQLASEDFKTRVTQKFKNTTFAQAVTKNVNQIDDKLTKKFGKPYILAKKFLKLSAKVGYGYSKSIGLFAVAGMASPVGIPALIAYNTAKNWKEIKKQVNDPNISKAKKVGLYLGAGITTTLSAIGASGSVGELANTVGMESIGSFCMQASTSLGLACRTAAAAVGATIPNWIEKISLKIKAKKISNQIKNSANPERINELLAEQKKIQAMQEVNRNELVTKGLSVALGSAFGMALREGISAHNETPASQPEETAQTSQETPQTESTSEQTAHESQTETTSEQPASESQTELTPEKQQAAHNLEAAKAENSGSNGQSSFDNAKTVLNYLQTHNPSDRDINPDAVATSLSEHLGENAGKTAMSCAMAPYALQNALHLDLPDGQAPTTHNMMSYIAEHGLTTEQQQAFNQFAEQNFDENGKFHLSTAAESHTPANHSAAQPDATHGYKPSATETHEEPKTQTPPEEKQPEYRHKEVPQTGNKVVDYLNDKYATEKTDGTGGFHFEAVDKLPGQDSQPHRTQVEPEPTHHPQPEQSHPQPRSTPHHVETYDVTSATGWAASRGLILDPYLTAGLNRIGDDGCSGYSGAYIDPNTGKVFCVPNDPVHDKPYVLDNPRLAKEFMNTNTGPWCHTNAGHQNWYGGCSDSAPRHLHGSGIITTNNSINRVLVGIQTATNVATNIAATFECIRHTR